MDRQELKASGLVGLDRVHVSRRLKAGRWLAGGADEQGRPVALSPEELAQREPLRSNGITANAIAEIERMVKTHVRPKDLMVICEGLGLPAEWFSEEDLSRLFARDADEVALRLAEVEAALSRLVEAGPIAAPPDGLLQPPEADRSTSAEGLPPAPRAAEGSGPGTGR